MTHGGSGLADADFREAIKCGISKVNIFTDINVAAAEAAHSESISIDKGITEIIPGVVEAVKKEAVKKIKLFNGDGSQRNIFSE